MADNTSRARSQVDGHRRAIRDHIEKWKKYPAAQDKTFALKTIGNAQSSIAKLRKDHPSIKDSWEDSWSPS